MIRLRREKLVSALRNLTFQEAVILILLASQACPTSGRVWTSSNRIAEDLGLSPTLVESILDRLELLGHLDVAPARGSIRVVELGPVVVRDGDAPENLPVAPDPVCP